MVPEDLYYTKEHEWLRVSGNRGRVGITHHAQEELGDVVFLELPEVGQAVAAGQAFAVVESVKAASDIYAPLAGKVVAVNEALRERPELVNADPYGEGWIAELELADPGAARALLSAQAYRDLTGTG